MEFVIELKDRMTLRTFIGVVHLIGLCLEESPYTCGLKDRMTLRTFIGVVHLSGLCLGGIYLYFWEKAVIVVVVEPEIRSHKARYDTNTSV